MKIINAILCIIFLAFAGLQFNDPDPVVWVAIYGSIAVMSAFAIFRRYRVWVMVLVLLGILYELITLFPDFMDWIKEGMPSITGSMHAETPHIELVREFLGVVICLAALVFHFTTYRRMTANT